MTHCYNSENSKMHWNCLSFDFPENQENLKQHSYINLKFFCFISPTCTINHFNLQLNTAVTNLYIFSQHAAPAISSDQWLRPHAVPRQPGGCDPGLRGLCAVSLRLLHTECKDPGVECEERVEHFHVGSIRCFETLWVDDKKELLSVGG